ncbi:DUF1861 family protein [Schleiferilactobacillus perolens]|jgi:hypothetical protein|uniref:DUF1861 family protein n=1 Tax=Schleiferilactobacillus perolens TaxID=100468 RepID=UPI00235598AF|nr:DUF1861 family protein [Schleiferilactobacillus perolens]MCI2170136.1 DUF1861 family protein [Schleiferilactobacillus perolens]
MQFTQLLAEHQKNSGVTNPRKIAFTGVDGFDVYNISAPFAYDQQMLIAGRVEKRDSEDSTVIFFRRVDDTHYERTDYPTLHLQDPFIGRLNDQLLVGGVHTAPTSDGKLTWRTDFYLGKDLHTLKLWLSGPEHMKDIRMAQLPNGQILVLTRPQGDEGKLGKIGYLVADSLAAITAHAIAQAPLLANNFADENWGGPNQIISATNEKVLVLGHIARRQADNTLQYVSLCFTVDIKNGVIKDPAIVATRQDFVPGPAKRPDLIDVIFSGGYDAENKRLYVGTSDAEAQFANIDLEGKRRR